MLSYLAAVATVRHGVCGVEVNKIMVQSMQQAGVCLRRRQQRLQVATHHLQCRWRHCLMSVAVGGVVWVLVWLSVSHVVVSVRHGAVAGRSCEVPLGRRLRRQGLLQHLLLVPRVCPRYVASARNRQATNRA